MRILVIIPIFGTFTYMSKNTSITLGDYFDQFVQGVLNQGRYKNTSEVLRAGLRLLEEEEKKIIVLRNAINEGINSGIVDEFNSDEHLASLKAERK